MQDSAHLLRTRRFLPIFATQFLGGYWSDRVYRVLGNRGFFLTRYTPGLEDFFVNHEHLVWFERKQELKPLAERYLRDPEARRRIAEAGFQHVRQHHTYDHRVREILAVLARTSKHAIAR